MNKIWRTAAQTFRNLYSPCVSLTVAVDTWIQRWFWCECLEPHNFGAPFIHTGVEEMTVKSGIVSKILVNDGESERKYRPQMVRYVGLKCYQSYVSFLASWSPECGCFWSATKSSDSALIGCTTISCTRHTAIQKTNQQKRYSPFFTPFHHICHICATLVAGTAQIPMRFPFDVSRLCRINQQLCINRPSCWDAYCILYHGKSRMSQTSYVIGPRP